MKKTHDFPVCLQDIFTNSDNLLSKIEKRKAIIRTDTNEVLGVVSDKYQLLTHSEVVNGFRKALNNYNFQEQIKLANNGAKMFAVYKIPEIQFEVAGNDMVSLQFIVKNSYDSTNALQIVFGAFRFVCANGMIIGQKFFNYSQKHIGSVGLDVKQLRERVSQLTNQFQETVPIIQRMGEVQMSEDVEAIFGDSKEMLLPTYLIDEAKTEYQRAGDYSVWGWYNSMTWAITHKMRKDNPQLTLNYGKIAWELAKDQMVA